MRHKSSQSYSEKLRDPRWQKLRLQVFERDKFHCQSCGSPDKELQVHHKAYVNGCEPWEYSSESLVTVCADCHNGITRLKHDIGWFLHNPDYFSVMLLVHRTMTSEMAADFMEIITSMAYKKPQELCFASSIMETISEWSHYSWLQGRNFEAQKETKEHDHTNPNTATAQ